MRLRKYIWVMLIFSISLMLSSCTIPLTIHLYNNTEKDITVVIFDKSGEERQEFVKKQTILKTEFDVVIERTLYVIEENGQWEYTIFEPNSRYWKYEGIGPFVKRVVRLELKNDGRIYILTRDDSFDKADYKTQPEGYPLNRREGSGVVQSDIPPV